MRRARREGRAACGLSCGQDDLPAPGREILILIFFFRFAAAVRVQCARRVAGGRPRRVHTVRRGLGRLFHVGEKKKKRIQHDRVHVIWHVNYALHGQKRPEKSTARGHYTVKLLELRGPASTTTAHSTAHKVWFKGRKGAAPGRHELASLLFEVGKVWPGEINGRMPAIGAGR